MGTHGKVSVELGAWDGKLFSNTYDLAKNSGWIGYMIEANAEKFRQLQETYRGTQR